MVLVIARFRPKTDRLDELLSAHVVERTEPLPLPL
jgi:hypothetical protein